MGNTPSKRVGCPSSKSYSSSLSTKAGHRSSSRSCTSSPIPTIVIEPCVEFEFEQLNRDQFRIPLTDMEIFALTTTWTSVKRNLTLNGMDMFSRMFQTRKDVKDTFDRFAHYSSTEELWESKLLERHGAAVMTVIDDIIINLDDEKYVVDVIIEQGARHAKFYGFSAQLFWAVEPAFMATVSDSLGPTLTPTLKDIYGRAIHYVLETLVISFEHCVSQMYNPYYAAQKIGRSSSI